MDWPHDPDGEEGNEGEHKYGQVVIVKKVDEDENLPLNKVAFVRKYGNHPTQLDSEHVASLSDIFKHVEDEEFDNFVELHEAVGKATREDGFQSYEDAAQFVAGKEA